MMRQFSKQPFEKDRKQGALYSKVFQMISKRKILSDN